MDYGPAEAARISWSNIVEMETKRKKKSGTENWTVHSLPLLCAIISVFIIFPGMVAKKPTGKCSGVFGSLASRERTGMQNCLKKKGSGKPPKSSTEAPRGLHCISGEQSEKQQC